MSVSSETRNGEMHREVLEGQHTNGDGTNRLPMFKESTPLPFGDNGDSSDVSEHKILPRNDMRDSKGRFIRGNPGGPGNPFARQVAGFRRAVCRAVTQRDLELLAQSQLDRAQAGDDGAAALLLAYTVGKPNNAVNPDTVNLEEWQLMKKMPVPGGDLIPYMKCLTPEMACELVRIIWPIAAKNIKNQFGAIARGESASA